MVAKYNLYVVQITDLNLKFNVQTKQELKKKANRSLTCEQRINLCSTVAYTLNLQILFGHMYKSIAGYLRKRYSTKPAD